MRFRPVRTGISLAWICGSFLAHTTAQTTDDFSQHLRYERTVEVPAGAHGAVCAMLDADVFAHAAGRSGNDLRVYRNHSAAESAVPFALTESEAEQSDPERAVALNISARHGRLSFDLQMPQRAYSTIYLQIASHDFVGVASVSGSAAPGLPKQPLGTFAIFDLSSKHLGRSTALSLAETELSTVHVELQLWTPAHTVMEGVSPAMVQGAMVPPSREAQTLYTTVARTAQIMHLGGHDVAEMSLAAHVPLEQITVELDPGYHGSFLSGLTVNERPAGKQDMATTEQVHGTISRVELPLYMDANPQAVIYSGLSVPAVMAANLRSDAKVDVVIDDSVGTLPIRAVRLEMRQRMVCFNADADDTYVVRYGDDALVAPVYNENAMPPYQPVMKPIAALLGPERLNLAFMPRTKDVRRIRPEAFWITLLALITVLGTLARHGVRRAGKKV